ncbi:Maf-domain-containing protein [Trichodelitschia bisporula]|uniref:Maf-domain-containing protein n=1 Tax=Trichodelitschia bisporula TaxID=703511 RepID=A0A6G1I0X9_9PEZI|nr:Maf-domain-containing protein [Trichodelitschia bisporula]
MAPQEIPSEPPPSYESSAKPSAVSGAAGGPAKPAGPRPPLPLNLPALVKLRGKRVILASASPRRRQLLAQIGLNKIEVIPSSFAEDFSKSLSPFEYVVQTATQKAISVYEQEIDNEEKGDPALLIAADTVVVSHYGEILEKPRSEVDHLRMLKMLRDTGPHKVYTAVAVMVPLEGGQSPGYALETHVEETSVTFDSNVTDDLILAYVRTREGADKAGGYGIQGLGAILIEGINGSYDCVVGLPLRATLQLIEKILTPDEEGDIDAFAFDG